MRILVPVDASVHSRNAIRYVVGRQTLKDKADIDFVTVIKPLPTSIERYLTLDALEAYKDAEAETALGPVIEEAKAAGFSAHVELLTGDPIESIKVRVEKTHPDLIVMGARGMRNVKSWLLGSVSRGVLSQTKTPVLLIRGDIPPVDRPLKIGLCVDGSFYGDKAADYVIAHPELFGDAAQLHLIYVADDIARAVMPSMVSGAVLSPSSQENLAIHAKEWETATKTVEQKLKAAGQPYIRACLAGLADEAIPAYADEQELDLLVMGSHGWGNFKSLMLGSTTQRVAALSEIPLLIIR